MARVTQAGVVTLLFVLLTVGSLGLVAATIDSVIASEHSASGEPREQAPLGGEDRVNLSVSGEGTGQASANQQLSLTFCIPILQTLPAVAGIFFGMASFAYGTYRRTNAATAGLVSAGLGPIVMLAYFVLTNCRSSGSGGGAGILSGSDILQSAGGINAPQIPPVAVVVLFFGAAVGGAVLLHKTGSHDEPIDPQQTSPESQPDESAFARAAGAAADRIEQADTDVDNAVYRAWVEMTALLEIDDPETTPPSDFAEAAIATGLARDDVEQLTALFTEVRYGGKSADDREQRALAALRNIERTYQESLDQDGGTDR